MSVTQNHRTVSDRSPREAVIRDLYALAAFYVANPEHPLPRSIDVSHSLADAAAVDRWATEHNTVPFDGPTSGRRMAWIELGGTSIRIEMTVGAYK